MEALIAAFMDALAGGAEGGMSEAVAGGGMANAGAGSMGEVVRPEISMSSLGDTAMHFGKQAMAPAMEAYNTMTNPNSTSGDMVSGAYKYAFSPQGKEDEQNMTPPQMRMGGGMGGMANNYVGGIPSLLQGYGGASQGILPYIAGR